MDIYLKFDTPVKCRAHLRALGFPKRGRNTRTRREAHENKQQTERPFPIESMGPVRIMKVDESYTDRKNATEITKVEAQSLGVFLPRVEEI